MDEPPATTKLRHAVRAIILADDDRVLLCRFSVPHPAVPTGATVVWAAPGGGIEPGELPLAALGFPPPGHAYWTSETLTGVAQRYPGLDMSPWRSAV